MHQSIEVLQTNGWLQTCLDKERSTYNRKTDTSESVMRMLEKAGAESLYTNSSECNVRMYAVIYTLEWTSFVYA